MPDDFLEKFKRDHRFTPPKETEGGVDYSVPSVLDDEFSKLGYSPTARLSMLGDVGRENSWNRDTIFKGHSDPANNAFNRGIISWQGDRQAKLNNYLRQQGVYGKGNDDELRGMARFMDQELKSDYPDVHSRLRNASNTYDASEALRQYIKYNPGGGYNTYDKDFRTVANKEWATKAKARGLASAPMQPKGFDQLQSDILGVKAKKPKPLPTAATGPTFPTSPPPSPSSALPEEPQSTLETLIHPVEQNPYTIKSDDGKEFRDAESLFEQPIPQGARRIVDRQGKRYLMRPGETAKDEAGNEQTNWTIEPETDEKPKPFSLRTKQGQVLTETPADEKKPPLKPNQKRLVDQKGNSYVATETATKDLPDGSTQASYAVQQESPTGKLQAAIGGNLTKKFGAESRILQSAQTYGFEKTGKLKLNNGTELTLDRSLPESDGKVRFRDQDGETYLFNKESGKLEDESLKQVADQIPVRLATRGTDPSTAKSLYAGQVAEQVQAKYGIDKHDAADWLLNRGVTDWQTGQALPEERFYASNDQMRARDRRMPAAKPLTSTIGPDGQRHWSDDNPEIESGADDTFHLTRRNLRDIAQYAEEAKKQRVARLLDYASKGGDINQSTLAAARLTQDDLNKNWDGYQQALVVGKVTREELEKRIPRFTQAGSDRYQAEILARKSMGIIDHNEADSELAAYERIKQRETEKNSAYLSRSPSQITDPGMLARIGDPNALTTPEQNAAKAKYWTQASLDYLKRKYGSFARVEQEETAAKAEEEAARERVKNDPWGKFIVNASQSAVYGTLKGAVKGLGSMVEGAPVWTKPIANYIDSLFGTHGSEIKDNAIYKLGKWINASAETALPTSKAYDTAKILGPMSIGSVAQAVGSSLGFLPAAAGGPAGIATFATLQMSGDSYDQAIADGATEEQAQLFARLNGGLFGWTETLGMGHAFERLLKGEASKFWRKVALDAIKESSEEIFLNEGPQEVGENVLAKLTYDPTRSWDAGTAEGLSSVGVSVPLQSLLVSALLHLKNRHAIRSLVRADQANGGPRLRDLGENGLYIDGKRVEVTPLTQPLLDEHRKLHDELGFGYDAIQRIRTKIQNSQDQNERLNLARTARDLQQNQLNTYNQQAGITQRIIDASGKPPDSLLEQKAKAEDAEAVAKTESNKTTTGGKTSAVNNIPGSNIPETHIPSTEESGPTTEAPIQVATPKATAQPKSFEDLQNDVLNGKPNETKTEIPQPAASVAENENVPTNEIKQSEAQVTDNAGLAANEPENLPEKPAVENNAVAPESTEGKESSEVNKGTLPAESAAIKAEKPKPPVRVQGIQLKERAADESKIVNPINPELPQGEKVQKLVKLSKENEPHVQKIVDRIKNEIGIESKLSFKEPEKILGKANRPEIKAQKPYFDVEHVRDALRFKAALNSFDDLPRIKKILDDEGIQVVKVDTEKMLHPKEWGWRFAALDLKMPNGQLVEFYAPMKELEAKGVKDVNHDLFDKWRGKTENERLANKAEFRRDQKESYNRYQRAWEAALSRLGLDDSAVEASWNKTAALLGSSTGEKLSLRSSAEATPRRQEPSSNIAATSSESTENRPESESSETDTFQSGSLRSNTSAIATPSEKSIPQEGKAKTGKRTEQPAKKQNKQEPPQTLAKYEDQAATEFEEDFEKLLGFTDELADIAKSIGEEFGDVGNLKKVVDQEAATIDAEKYDRLKKQFEKAQKYFEKRAKEGQRPMFMLLETLHRQFGMSAETIRNLKPYIVRYIAEQKATAEGVSIENAHGQSRPQETGTKENEPTAAEAKESVKSEKINPRTGLTPTQTDYLAKELEQIAYSRLKEEHEFSTTDEFLERWEGQFPADTIGSVLKTDTSKIKVPGDGTFTVYDLAAANRLHQKITGKPIPGFDKAKGATIPALGSNRTGPSKAADDGAALALELYGTPEKAVAFLTEQRELLDAKTDEKHLRGLDEAIRRLEGNYGEVVSFGGEPLTTVGKEAKAEADKRAKEYTKDAQQRIDAAFTKIQERIKPKADIIRKVFSEEIPRPKKHEQPAYQEAESSYMTGASAALHHLTQRENRAPEYREPFDSQIEMFADMAATHINRALGLNPEVRNLDLSEHFTTGELAQKLREKRDEIYRKITDLREKGGPNKTIDRLRNRLYPIDNAIRVLNLSDEGEASGLKKVIDNPSSITETPEFKAWFGDSKMVDDNGDPIVAFHGTSREFDTFRDNAGAAHDAGFYGKGFYFTFQSDPEWQNAAKGEAGYYGKNVMPVYLKIEKPFDISKLSEYKGVRNSYVGYESLIFLRNLAEKFPDIAKSITVPQRGEYVDGEAPMTDVPISVLPELFDKYEKLIKIVDVVDREDELKYKTAYTKEEPVEHTDQDGKIHRWTRTDTFGHYSKDLSNAELRQLAIIDAIEKYEGIEATLHPEGYMTRNPEITEAIKAQGYDGIVQSMQGDEAVVFSPNQIKSATDNRGTFDPNDPNILARIVDDAETEADRMTVEEMRALQHVPFDDLLTKNPQAEIINGQIKADTASHEIFRRAFEQAKIEKGQMKLGSKKAEDLFSGQFMEPEFVDRTREVLEKKAAEAKKKGYSDEETKVLDTFADLLKQSADANKGTAIVYVFDHALPHELFHQADYMGAAEKTILNRHSDEYKEVLDNHPVTRTLWNKHFSKFATYNRQRSLKTQRALLRAEIPPMLLELSDKQLKDFGITPEQRDDYLLTWFKGYAAKNGVDALDTFDREEFNVQDFIGKAKDATRAELEARGTGKAYETDRGKKPQPTEQPAGAKRGPPSDRGRETGLDEDELVDNERLASLPATLRRAGIDASDLAYEVFGDSAARESAENLLNENGLEGSIKLLRSLKAEALDVDHALLSFMVQRILLDHAEELAATDPQAAIAQRNLALKLGREHSLKAVGAGRFTRAASIIGQSVEGVMYSVQGVVADVYGEDKSLTPEDWKRVEAAARRLEQALAKAQALAKEGRSKDREIKRLKEQLEGVRAARRPDTSLARRKKLVAQIKKVHKPEDIEAIKNRLKERFAPSASLASVLAEPSGLKKIVEPEEEEFPIDDFAEVGAYMLTEGLAKPEEYLPKDFRAEMVAEFGDVIEPHFDEIYKKAWEIRDRWLKEIRRDVVADRIKRQEKNPDLEDWETDAILGDRQERLRRRKAIETMHRLVSKGKTKTKRNDRIEDLIAKFAPSDEVAAAALLQSRGIRPEEIYSKLSDLGVNKSGEQREIFRQAQKALSEAKAAYKRQQDKIANELAAKEKEKQDIDDLRFGARMEAKRANDGIAEELRRVKQGKLSYYLGQLYDATNALRTLMASFDLSAKLRQGGFFTFAYPVKQLNTADLAMFKSFTEKQFGRVVMDIERNARFRQAQRMGIDFAFAGKLDEDFKGEELFRGRDFIQKIPALGWLIDKAITGWSERTYTAFLDMQRMTMYDLFAQELEDAGLTTIRNGNEFRKIADFVNVATGRGIMPKNKFARILMELPLFAPRYTLSRIQLINMTLNPVAYWNTPPHARKIIGYSAARFAFTGWLILALAAAAGLTTLDPDDDDFGKIKIGSARFDIWAGELQPMKLFLKMGLAGYRGNRIQGEMFDSMGKALERFVRGKLSPLASLTYDRIKGADYNGKEFSWKTGLVSRLTPLTISDAIDSYKLDGAKGTALTVPLAVFGVGVQSYKDRPEEPKTEAEKLAAKAVAMGIESKPQTDDDQKKRGIIQELTARSRKGEDVKDIVNSYVDDGVISKEQRANILAAKDKTYLQDKAEGLPLDQFEAVLREATPEEIDKLREIGSKKLKNAEKEGKLDDATNARFAKIGIGIVGDYPIPDAIKDEFERLGIDRPDVGESLTLRKRQPRTKLNFEQYDQYRKDSLKEIYGRVEQVMKTDTYKKADDATKEFLIQRMIRKGREREQKVMKRQLIVGASK